MEPIYVEGVSKSFGKLQALNNVSLRIKRGNCVGLLGPNGAGKSTLLKMICGLIRPSTGIVRLQGHDPFYRRKEALQGVGCVIEEPIVYTSLDPITYLSYLGELRGMKNPDLSKRIEEVLEFTNLTRWSRTKIGKFSRGMRQKLVLAQAILPDPEILLLDEPGLGLDPETITNIRDYLRHARKEGKTIFMASHMLEEVKETCNQVALLNAGHLIRFGDISMLEKLFAKSLLIVTLESPTPSQIKRIERIPWIEAISITGKKINVKLAGGEKKRAELLRILVKDIGLKVVSYYTSIPPIEEVYLRLVREAREKGY
ncbi:MAG: ABC transporter ATP-binding protein [Candidatus Hadarchaeales archaeon]